ncbi:tautomerase family protein [Pseudomonas fontis]|uniref:2-hydroxymuconate tautomerase n=1 Tax=Pseudomonas fontis TaxID=2942633 RepID=A0ABT5NME5_9PSED|nr:4-oxalocrotonate tautomerase family protein [Pseudomonas fontis]MDD0976596.1 4-oxalocrotonate tautomerase family protein [Pseudomonas fontis]MDD0988944.1 4-oxalocrotonate tautomerase family protein [Pseudomonas fontis]
MPYVHIRVTDEGVTAEQKRELIEATTAMLERILNKPPASTFVVIEEVPTDNWGAGGETVTAIRLRENSRTR